MQKNAKEMSENFIKYLAPKFVYNPTFSSQDTYVVCSY